jgi:hypothetical protein
MPLRHASRDGSIPRLGRAGKGCAAEVKVKHWCGLQGESGWQGALVLEVVQSDSSHSRKCHPEQREGSRQCNQILRVAQDDNITQQSGITATFFSMRPTKFVVPA